MSNAGLSALGINMKIKEEMPYNLEAGSEKELYILKKNLKI